MSYSKKIKYHIYTTTDNGSFIQQVHELLMQINPDYKVLRLSFFGSIGEEIEYTEKKKIIISEVTKYFHQEIPTLSFIAQSTLNSHLTLEVHAYIPDSKDSISYKILDGLPYVLLENDNLRMLFAGGFQGDTVSMSIQEQSTVVFKQIDSLMKKENFSINGIIRQWNYIERITDLELENQHYQLFNNARSSFYAQTEWNNGYPAATGIGASKGGILVDLDAVSIKSVNVFATPIDNKLQIAAHAYSDNVLLDANNNKATPKFERAKALNTNNDRLIYISGTAAIRGENSLEGVGLAKQLKITMENIKELINEAKIELLRVYLKNPADYEIAKMTLDAYDLNIPISYLCADVCRGELLIEIEGVAKELK